MQERSEAIPLEPPSTKADESPKEILKEGDKLGSAPSPVPSLLKGHLAHLTNDGDPESDSGLPDRSSEPNQQPQVDSAGGAVESIGTASSSPPPPLLRHRDSPSSSPRISRIDTHGRLQVSTPKCNSDPISGPSDRYTAGLSIAVNTIQLLVSLLLKLSYMN